MEEVFINDNCLEQTITFAQQQNKNECKCDASCVENSIIMLHDVCSNTLSGSVETRRELKQSSDFYVYLNLDRNSILSSCKILFSSSTRTWCSRTSCSEGEGYDILAVSFKLL